MVKKWLRIPWTALWVLLALPSALPAANLVAVYRSALENDPEYLSAGASNRATQEARPQARALLLPELDFSASVTANRADAIDSGFSGADIVGTSTGIDRFFGNNLSVNITQPIYRRDRAIALAQADASIRQSNAEYAFALQDLFVRVAEAYFGVLRSLDELGFSVAESDAIRQQLEQSQQRFDVGLIAVTDVEEAQAGFDLANARVIAAENQLDNANEALREITGEYYDKLALLTEDMPLVTPEPNDIDDWTAVALEQNYELAAARYASERLRDDIRRVQSGHLPTLDLVGSSSLTTNNGKRSNDNERLNSALSLQLNLPIYQGGIVLSQTRESRHRYQQALDDEERQRRATQRQTRNAFLGVLSGISQVRALNQAVRSTESALRAIDAGFQVGTRTSVDVLNAERDLFRAKRDYAAARYDYVLDILRLKRAAGTLSDEDLIQVNTWLTR